MNKLPAIFVLICLFSVIFSFLYSFAEERITLTTYYPAPYGVYREMRVNGLAVGSAYRNMPVNITDGILIVGNKIGIGTEPIGTPALQIEASGNGSTAFIHVASIDGMAGIAISSEYSGTVRVYSADDLDDLRFFVGGDDRIIINSTGSVGINTINPTELLHVSAGNMRLDTNQFLLFGSPTESGADPMWIRRVNVASDHTVLQINIGDYAGTGNDRIAIGSHSVTDGWNAFNETLSITREGDITARDVWLNNATNVDGTTGRWASQGVAFGGMYQMGESTRAGGPSCPALPPVPEPGLPSVACEAGNPYYMFSGTACCGCPPGFRAYTVDKTCEDGSTCSMWDWTFFCAK